MFAARLPWVSITPFGKPVVPLEYGSAARSPGPVGSGANSGPRSSSVPTRRTRASPAASATAGASSADVTTNRARASPSCLAISAGVSAGFTGVTTPPRSSAAWKTTANSGMFGKHDADDLTGSVTRPSQAAGGRGDLGGKVAVGDRPAGCRIYRAPLWP